MNKVFIYGSINTDFSIECARIPLQGETIGGFNFIASPGGKGANQAVAAAKSGAASYLLGKVGSDEMGSSALKSLTEYGVDCSFILKDGSKTGVAIIIRSDNDNRIICDYGANMEISSAEVLQILQSNASEGDILLCQFECEVNEVISAIIKAKEIGMKTILNPAPACKISDEIYKYIDYLIVNQTESHILSEFYPKSTSECMEPLNFFIKHGVGAAIVTLGDKGSVCLSDDFAEFPAYKVAVVDTTAAGDTYAGAFAACLARGEDLKSALNYATAASAIAITRLGAQQSVPDHIEIMEFLKENKNA